MAYQANIGTLARTRDAVGACLALQRRDASREALGVGNTLRSPICVHWLDRADGWVTHQRASGARIVAVELAEDATRLADLAPARERTVVLLGHEHHGVADHLWDRIDDVVESPWWVSAPAPTSPSPGPWRSTGWPVCPERTVSACQASPPMAR